jgi:hypothetical protein
MEKDYLQLVKAQYEYSREDATRLFETLLEIARAIGWNATLNLLETCVIERRMAWLDRHEDALERTDSPVADGYKLFYEEYLGLALPRDGELVEENAHCIRVRWRNRCPTLEACQKLGLDTREVCRKAYDRPVQRMLARIDPRLRFRRNYAALRPELPYCEESIELDSE